MARIEELVERIAETKRLRREAMPEADGWWLAAVASSINVVPKSRLLGEVAQVICGQHLGPDEQADHGTPYITGPADFTDRMACPTRFASVVKATSQPGDVLLTVKGAGVGKVNLAPPVTAVIGRQLYALRPYQALLDETYLWIVLQYRLAELRDAITATTVPGIGRRDVEPLQIPLPSLTEQQRIVAHLENLREHVNALRHLQSETATELEALLPSVLDKAFRGEL